MDVEYGMLVVDKNGKTLGTVDYIIMDSWSGEPRKFMVRQETEAGAVYFSPQHVAGTTKGKIKLNVSVEGLEQT